VGSYRFKPSAYIVQGWAYLLQKNLTRLGQGLRVMRLNCFNACAVYV
jgi:hypothetical protein